MTNFSLWVLISLGYAGFYCTNIAHCVFDIRKINNELWQGAKKFNFPAFPLL